MNTSWAGGGGAERERDKLSLHWAQSLEPRDLHRLSISQPWDPDVSWDQESDALLTELPPRPQDQVLTMLPLDLDQHDSVL